MNEHLLSERFRKNQPVRIWVVGAGGSGSAIFLALPYLNQAMRVWGYQENLDVTLIDGDTVSETNCIRQPFSFSDIGLNKATVLVNRVNLFWGMAWKARPQHLSLKGTTFDEGSCDLLIGCVDTRAARKEIQQAVARPYGNVGYWLDLGNNASSGQYILGQPLNSKNRRTAARLRTVAELYPEIADPGLGEDSLPSCSALEALERQEPFINQVLATSALAMLARLFRYGSLAHHGAFYNASTGRMSALPVDPGLWKKIRRRSLRIPEQPR